MSTTTFLIVLHVILATFWASMCFQVQMELTNIKWQRYVSFAGNFLFFEVMLVGLLISSIWSNRSRFLLSRIWYYTIEVIKI